VKAKYIIEALSAMRSAEKFLVKMPGDEAFACYMELVGARCTLHAYSGIDDIEVEVEKEAGE
jgi:hypothetical protein